jgi:hypothetical protein
VAAAAFPIGWWCSAAALMVVIHFFLFCNVFRTERIAGLIWASAFIGLCAVRLFWHAPEWHWIFTAALFVSSVLIAWQIRKPSYHGILWDRWNPHLRIWWDARHNKDVSNRD